MQSIVAAMRAAGSRCAALVDTCASHVQAPLAPAASTALFGNLQLCWECQRRHKHKQRTYTQREDTLIQRALDDKFGSKNAYKGLQHKTSIIDARVKQRIDSAWHDVTLSNPHIRQELVDGRGLEMTDSHVFERGRRATVYYECNAGAEEYVAKYFRSASRWLGHQLGESMGLKTRPRFSFVHDGLSRQAEQLLDDLRAANTDILTEASAPQRQERSVAEQSEQEHAPSARGRRRHRPALVLPQGARA